VETIARIRVFLIASPIKMARRQGVGDVQGSVKRVLLEITSSSGVIGWGEAAPWAVFSGTAEAAFSALDQYYRDALMGKPVHAIRKLMQELDRVLVHHDEAKAAIEMALFDIVGKLANLSVAELLGGRVRDEIPLSFSIADPDFDADLVRMRQMVAMGHRIYKVKTGVNSHRLDLAHLEAIRHEFGEDIDLRVDYNQALPPFGAITLLRDVAQYRPTFIEQPVPRDCLSALAAYARALDTPILADESCFSARDLLHIIRLEAAAAISVKLMKTGGMLKAQALMAIADAAHVPVQRPTQHLPYQQHARPAADAVRTGVRAPGH